MGPRFRGDDGGVTLLLPPPCRRRGVLDTPACAGYDTLTRHCERSEAIQSQSSGDNGLLRRFAPRNDGFQLNTARNDD
jgi:hypothetical protein